MTFGERVQDLRTLKNSLQRQVEPGDGSFLDSDDHGRERYSEVTVSAAGLGPGERLKQALPERP